MPKRSRTAGVKDNKTSSKRFRTTIDKSADALMCPITHELPLHPVMAEDGKVYERAAIEKWLEDNDRSPMTNLVMGDKLINATQTKELIELMVESGALPEDKVREWKKKKAEEEEVKSLLDKADKGDATAAYKLSEMYLSGSKGVTKDEDKYIFFLKKVLESFSQIW